MTLEDYLRIDAERYPDKIAAICGEEQISYRQLYERSAERAATIPTGRIIPFLSSQSIDFLVAYFAIHIAGSVAAPLEKDTPTDLFNEIAERLQSSTPTPGTADILYTTGTTGR